MPLFGAPRVGLMEIHRDVKGLRRATHYRKDSKVRHDAIMALDLIGDTGAVTVLIVALRDESPEVREAAATAIGNLRGTDALDALITALSAEALPGVRTAIVSALGRIGNARAVDALCAVLPDQNASVRLAATEALGRIGEQAAVAPLITALTDRDPAVRTVVAEALDRLGWTPDEGPSGAAYWIAKEDWVKCVRLGAAQPLIGLLADPDYRIRHGAISALAHIRPAPVDALVTALEHSNPDARVAVVETLARLHDPRAVEPLIGALDHGSGYLREQIAKALGELGDARAVGALSGLIGDEVSSVRQAAVDALRQIGGTSAVEALVQALTVPDADARRTVAAALDLLGWHPGRVAEQAAYRIAKQDWAACVEMGSVEGLIALLDDDELYIRARAAEALGEIGDIQAVEPLIRLLHFKPLGWLNRGEIGVIRAAAEALVALYSSGKATEEQKADILAERDIITFYDDVPDREGVPVRDDQTVGVDFPL